MPSSIADPLYERLLRAFPDDRAYTREDWSDEEMPEPIRHFLAQLLRHQSQLEAERLRDARTRWVDYDHPDMERAVRTFFAAVEEHMRVPRSEWADTLHQATHHVTSYLVQPTHVLGEFVFDDREGPLHVDQVMWRMKFFGPYAYLRDAVEAYVRQRDDDRLTRPVYETFLRRIDERITSEYDADRWLRLLGPLFRLVDTATGSRDAPIQPLSLFFREKGAAGIADTLERSAEQNGLENVGPKQLHALLRRHLGEPDPERTPDPPPLTRESSASDEPEQRTQRATPSSRPPTQSRSSESPSAESRSSQARPSQARPSQARPSQAQTQEPRPNREQSSREQSSRDESSQDAPAQYSMEDISRASRSSSASGSPQQEAPAQDASPQNAPPQDTQQEAPPQAASPQDAPSDAGDAAEAEAESDDQPPTSREMPPKPEGYDEMAGEDRGEIWGVEGSAREAAGESSDGSSSGSPGGAASGSGGGSAGGGSSGDDGSVPLWKQFQQGRSRSSQESSPAPSSSGEGDTPLWARFRTDRDRRGDEIDRSDSPASGSPATADESGGDAPRPTDAGDSGDPPPPPDSAGDLKALEQQVLGESNPPQRAVYVRQLFGDSMDHYVRVLERLQDVDTWGRASQIIAQDVFRRNKVNIYSDAAVQFTNAVEARYR
jgi:hypothetical protein